MHPLKEWRVKRGITIESLAYEHDLTPSTISALERGARRRVRPSTMEVLKAATGLSEDEIMGRVNAE
jgi:transcriptional regulator with XRE-family HTH domain